METGEVQRDRIVPASREHVRRWLTQFQGLDAHCALEATTGWRFTVEEIHAAGLTAHLAEPAETRTRYGRKRRAKTDHADCEHLSTCCWPIGFRRPGSRLSTSSSFARACDCGRRW